MHVQLHPASFSCDLTQSCLNLLRECVETSLRLYTPLRSVTRDYVMVGMQRSNVTSA